ncbi:MAG: uracil-DNA glycosylase, partial [Clostridia bacterium]|nr:uracil-DNA glycosylase [Clostridia bacterium]
MSETVKKELEELKKKCDSCKGCKLNETKTNTVFGTGNIKAKVMFVGEAPGEQEDLQGEPFVGASGKLLDKYLTVIDMPRESVYIANILKCRPPHNRDPLPEEEDACIDFLRKQLQLINPKI